MMEARAIAKFVRVSPDRARLVIDEIRGKLAKGPRTRRKHKPSDKLIVTRARDVKRRRRH